MIGKTISKYFPTKKYKRGNLILECKNLTQEGVLKNINIKIFSGEIVGLWGLLGSGRTELANAMFGMTKINSGEININSENNIGNRDIGFVPEDRKGEGLFMPLSVRENISIANTKAILNSTNFFLSYKKEKSFCNEYINKLDIKVTGLEQKIETLSGGNQQKVILARWVSNDPALFILDEPTKGIDIGAKAEINELIIELAKSGSAVFLITSEIEEIIGLSDRVYIIKNGSVVKELAKEDINKKNLIEAAS
jgi:ABC-type sugar transport system ATPase subunit